MSSDAVDTALNRDDNDYTEKEIREKETDGRADRGSEPNACLEGDRAIDVLAVVEVPAGGSKVKEGSVRCQRGDTN